MQTQILLGALMAGVISTGAAAQDWTGFYGGVQFGNLSVDDGGAPFDATNYGLHGGYLVDSGSIVYGGELSFDVIDFEAAAGVDSASSVNLKGILGYDAGQFLPYLALGASNLKIDTGTELSDTVMFYGVGVTAQVSPNLRVGLEYLRHEKDDFDGSGFPINSDGVSLRGSYNF